MRERRQVNHLVEARHRTSVAGTVNVAIVADRSTIRDALAHVLGADPDLRVLGSADGVESGLLLLARTQPQVVIVNLALGGSDTPGIRFIATAKARYPTIGILSLKRRVDEHLLRAALDAGADACCLATTSENRLRQAIKAVAEGATWLDPEISRILLHPVKPPAPHHDEPCGTLSPRESAILRLLTEGYTNDEIAVHLLCSEATVKTHLLHVFRKLNVHDRVSAAVAALRRGIV